MEPSAYDFLAKSLLNEQEMVRDYQRFADKMKNSEIAKSFYEWAEQDGMRAKKIEQFLHQIKEKED